MLFMSLGHFERERNRSSISDTSGQSFGSAASVFSVGEGAIKVY